MNLSELQKIYDKSVCISNETKEKYFAYKDNSHRNDNYVSNLNVKFESNFGISLHPLYSLPDYHSHSYLEVMYVIKGKFKNIVEGVPFDLNEGDIFFIPPGIYHSVDNADGIVPEECVMLNISVSANNAIDVFKFLFKNNPLHKYINDVFCSESYPKYAYIRTSSVESTDALMRLLHSYFLTERQIALNNSDTSIKFNVQSTLGSMQMQMCAKLLCNAIDLASGTEFENLLISTELIKTHIPATKMLEYLRSNCISVTLEDVAQKFNYSFSYTSKVIKRISGVGFAKLITQFRLESACEMLKSTKLPIQEIALRCGYASIEHFHRTFKEEFNMTPAQYRST